MGCIEEDDNGRGRDVIAHHERVQVMTAFWRRRAAAAAAQARLDIPTERYTFSPQVIRGVFGYLIFNAAGLAAAMNYLGDHSSDAVIGHFTALSGQGVPAREVAVLDVLGAPAAFRGAQPTAPDLVAFAEGCRLVTTSIGGAT